MQLNQEWRSLGEDSNTIQRNDCRIRRSLYSGECFVKIRTLIVDDEPHAREGIQIRLKEFKNLQIAGECSSGNGGSEIYQLSETRFVVS